MSWHRRDGYACGRADPRRIPRTAAEASDFHRAVLSAAADQVDDEAARLDARSGRLAASFAAPVRQRSDWLLGGAGVLCVPLAVVELDRAWSPVPWWVPLGVVATLVGVGLATSPARTGSWDRFCMCVRVVVIAGVAASFVVHPPGPGVPTLLAAAVTAGVVVLPAHLLVAVTRTVATSLGSRAVELRGLSQRLRNEAVGGDPDVGSVVLVSPRMQEE